MKKLLLTTALFAGSAVAAQAASLNDPIFEPRITGPAVAASDWAGSYVGGNFSWSRADFSIKGMPGVDTHRMFSPDGLGAGIRAGHDWQIDNYVLGLGADYNFGEITGPAVGFYSVDPIVADIKNTTTLFGRAGYDAGNFMPYVMAGYTWADVKGTDLGSNTSDKAGLGGATVGIGAERTVTEKVSMYSEISYTDFGTSNLAPIKTKTELIQAKVGLNFNF